MSECPKCKTKSKKKFRVIGDEMVCSCGYRHSNKQNIQIIDTGFQNG